jgi:hypothetical protein
MSYCSMYALPVVYGAQRCDILDLLLLPTRHPQIIAYRLAVATTT